MPKLYFKLTRLGVRPMIATKLSVREGQFIYRINLSSNTKYATKDITKLLTDSGGSYVQYGTLSIKEGTLIGKVQGLPAYGSLSAAQVKAVKARATAIEKSINTQLKAYEHYIDFIPAGSAIKDGEEFKIAIEVANEGLVASGKKKVPAVQLMSGQDIRDLIRSPRGKGGTTIVQGKDSQTLLSMLLGKGTIRRVIGGVGAFIGGRMVIEDIAEKGFFIEVETEAVDDNEELTISPEVEEQTEAEPAPGTVKSGNALFEGGSWLPIDEDSIGTKYNQQGEIVDDSTAVWQKVSDNKLEKTSEQQTSEQQTSGVYMEE